MSDFSPDALDVARKNYRLFEDRLSPQSSNLAVQFVHSSLLAYVDELQYNSVIVGKDVILVANLPYIPDAMFDANVDETVKKWEPRMAFVGGDDGLDLYREMFREVFTLQGSDFQAQSLVMFLEMMTWQIDILRAEFGYTMLFEEVKTFHFNIRIVKASLLG